MTSRKHWFLFNITTSGLYMTILCLRSPLCLTEPQMFFLSYFFFPVQQKIVQHKPGRFLSRKQQYLLCPINIIFDNLDEIFESMLNFTDAEILGRIANSMNYEINIKSVDECNCGPKYHAAQKEESCTLTSC